MKRLVSGIKPTGDLTLGNYIGAIKQFVSMQETYETYIFVADLHALTIYNDPKELNKRIKDIVAIYLAAGLNPKKTTIFVQSDNMYHANLSWVLECNTYMGEASRMIQYKEKSKKGETSVGLFTYPILMAADILIYDADVVPTGIDQKQHVELARDIAERFNKRYGDTFKMPEPFINEEEAKIYDLQDPTKKMSKSDELGKGCIMLLDDLKVARKKIKSAKTDSDNKIIYDRETKPGISNLITIYSSLTGKKIKEVEKEFDGKNYGEFKEKVADVVCDFLEDLQSKYNEFLNSGKIDKLLDESNKKVSKLAKEKVEDVYKKIGLGR